MDMLKNRAPRIDRSGIVRIPFPAEIAIETHSYCNLRCIICPYVRMRREKGVMSEGLFHKIIDEVMSESRGTRLWLAIMGEPLLDKNIISHLKYAREHGPARLHINTNGTYLEGKLAEAVLESGAESLYVAIDAVNAGTFDKVRPGGNFDKVRKNVENLLRLKSTSKGCKTEIVVQFIVMNENEDEADSFRDYWLSRGAVVKMRLRQGWGLNISAPDLEKASIERFPCPWLLRTMNVHWTGRVTQCDVDYEEGYSAGNLNEMSIKEVWHGELGRRRDLQWAGDYSHPLCKDCKDWAAGRAEFFYPDDAARHKASRWSLGAD